MVGTVKKSIDTVSFTWFARKVRHVCEVGFRRRPMYLLTLVSPMSMPSLRSSPWMRGAPQIGFSRLILRISLRISFHTGGRPRWPRRTFQVQNSRNPLRCHAMTVSGLTMQRAECHSSQTKQNQAHRNRSNRLSFGLFTERCSTPSWWRRAMISSCKAAQVRKTDSVEASKADNTAVEGNRRKVRNFHCISQIGICENHSPRGTFRERLGAARLVARVDRLKLRFNSLIDFALRAASTRKVLPRTSLPGN